MTTRITAALVLLASIGTAHADDLRWVGGFHMSDWSDPTLWSGGVGYPDDYSDTALIDSTGGSNPILDVDVQVGQVTIRDGRTLSTGGFQYSVFNSGGHSGDTIIEDAGSLLTIYDDPNNPTDAGTGLIINAGGTARLDTTDPVVVSLRKLQIAAGGLFEGAGTLNQLGRTGIVINSGTLRATGGTLMCNPWDATSLFDWDGGAQSGVIAIDDDSSLDLQIPVVSTFFGTLTMGENSVLNVATPWTLDDLAVFDVNAGSGTATIAGADFDLFSIFTDVNSGTLVLASASTYLWGGGPTAAQVTLAPGTALRIDGPANLGWSAGLHLGSGTLIINADTTIGAGTALSNFDWDGDGTATTIVDHGATLSIEVYELNLVNDTFSGTILVEDGTIDIALNDGEWELAGDLTFKCGSTPPTLRGAGLVVTGTVHNTGSGSSAIQNDIEIAPGGVVTNGPGAMPVFTGNLTLDGGSLAGMGSMTLGGPGADVTAPSLIDLDGDLLIDDATVLTIDAPLTLRCNDLTSATPGGGALAATVVVNAPGLLDYEHASPQASPFAGVLALNGDSPTVGAVLMTGDRVELAGTLNVENKAIIESPLDISGDVSLHGDGALVLRGGTTAAPTAFTSTCRVIGYGSPSTLTIDGAAQIESGASFLARVVLEVGATGELRTGQIDVLPSSFRCDGRLSFGPASNPVAFYATDYVGFGPDSRLDIRLGASGNDSVTVAPSVLGGVTMVEILGGELNVELTDGYVPPFGPLFTVVTNINTNGVRIGQFDTVTGPPNMSVIYTATAVYVTFADPACSPADLDANGTLNLDDVNLFANAFVVGDSLADLDGNGALNLDDVNTFASAFVAGCP